MGLGGGVGERRDFGGMDGVRYGVLRGRGDEQGLGGQFCMGWARKFGSGEVVFFG